MNQEVTERIAKLLTSEKIERLTKSRDKLLSLAKDFSFDRDKRLH